MTDPDSSPPPLATVIAPEVAKSSGWYIALGVLLIIVGIAMVANPLFTGLTVSTMVAFLFIVAGGMYLINAWMARSGGGFLARLLLGVLTGGVGIYVAMNPDRGLVALTVVLGVVIGVVGVLRILLARALVGVPGVGGLYFSGLVSILLALLIIAKLPSASEVVIGILLGIDMLSAGITTIMVATRARAAAKTVAGS